MIFVQGAQKAEIEADFPKGSSASSFSVPNNMQCCFFILATRYEHLKQFT